MGVLCFVLLIDTPALSGRWLEPDEIRYLELRQIARQVHRTYSPEEKPKKFGQGSCRWTNSVPGQTSQELGIISLILRVLLIMTFPVLRSRA